MSKKFNVFELCTEVFIVSHSSLEVPRVFGCLEYATKYVENVLELDSDDFPIEVGVYARPVKK